MIGNRRERGAKNRFLSPAGRSFVGPRGSPSHGASIGMLEHERMEARVEQRCQRCVRRRRPTALKAHQSPSRSGVVMDDVTYDDKTEQFERLWDNAPQRHQPNRALKFRQYVLDVRQTKRPLTRENARKYWMSSSKIRPGSPSETREGRRSAARKPKNRRTGCSRRPFNVGPRPHSIRHRWPWLGCHRSSARHGPPCPSWP